MKNRLSTAFAGLLGLLMLMGCTQLFVAGQKDAAGADIEGVWRTSVTLRNCQTGQPLPGAFKGILLFNQGGTMTGTSTAVSSVYGTWKREAGPHEYSFRSLSFRVDANGALLGTRVISQNVTIDGAASMATNGEFQDYDVTGALVASGCSTATGTRF